MEKGKSLKKIMYVISLLFLTHLFWRISMQWVNSPGVLAFLDERHLLFQLCWVFSGHQWSGVHELQFLFDSFFFSYGKLSTLEYPKDETSWVYKQQSMLVLGAIPYISVKVKSEGIWLFTCRHYNKVL